MTKTPDPVDSLLHPEKFALIIEEVAAERGRQDARWGEQNHPLAPPYSGPEFYEYQRVSANMIKAANDRAAANGTLSWRDILDEERYEAMAEPDWAKMRAELIQVAAVVVAMIESGDRAAAKIPGGQAVPRSPEQEEADEVAAQEAMALRSKPLSEGRRAQREEAAKDSVRMDTDLSPVKHFSHVPVIVGPSERTDMDRVDSCPRRNHDTRACRGCGEPLEHDRETESRTGKLHGDCTLQGR